MLDKTLHEQILRQILVQIFKNHKLAKNLGFKGGTACYLFYDLPRFSTDLDFNFMSEVDPNIMQEEMRSVLGKIGILKEDIIKKNTIFFLLQYAEKQNQIKVEISTRESELINEYDLREFFGVSISVMKKEFIFANKLIALTQRSRPTSRDLYDINFFFKNLWQIEEKPIKTILKMETSEYLETLPEFIRSKFNQKSIHHGLGQLLSSTEEIDGVRKNLIEDTISQIEIYLATHN